jgi:phospholipid transport system transporter-binding protein
MSKNAEVRIENNTLYLCGDLDFSNAILIYQQSQSLFSSGASALVIDFSGLRSANSVVMALIIDWMRRAKRADKSIQFKHLSSDVMSLARASGLDKVIAPVSV